MLRITSARPWRASIVIIVTALCVVGVAPSQASAGTTPVCQNASQAAQYGCTTPPPKGGAKQYQLAGANYVGWAYLDLNFCAEGMACTLAYRMDTPSYRWNHRKVIGWSAATIQGGWVYVYPFSGDWRWLYTANDGWNAVYAPRLELRG